MHMTRRCPLLVCRDALESQLVTIEEQKQVLLREQKERVRMMKHQATELQEHEVKISALERSLSESRKALKASEVQAERAGKQGRADREVLVECVRQVPPALLPCGYAAAPYPCPCARRPCAGARVCGAEVSRADPVMSRPFVHRWPLSWQPHVRRLRRLISSF